MPYADIEKRRQYSSTRYSRDIDKQFDGTRRQERLRVKKEVLTHYGDGKCACMRCGFDDIRALSIDHINGDGNKEHFRGIAFYRQLRLADYPEGYQTLCMNCQYIKRFENKEHGGGRRKS